MAIESSSLPSPRKYGREEADEDDDDAAWSRGLFEGEGAGGGEG